MKRLTLPLALVLAVPSGALADAFKPRLGYGVAPASEGVTVTWNTEIDRATVVEIRPAAGGDWVRYEGASELWDPVGHHVHSVDVDGLSAWTEYVYRAGDGQNWSEEYGFTTAPENPCTPFRFVALGDERSQDDFGPDRNWAPILTEALGDSPAFILNGGDLVKEGKEHVQWLNWLDMTDDLFAEVVHLPTIGNHDDDRVDGDDAHYNTIFTLPRNIDSGTEDYWYARYADLTIVSLSTATFDDDGFVAQAAWMDQVFTDNPTRWKIVFFHHPVYTAGREPLLHDPNEVGQNARFVPIFDAHHVDLVLQSHNHWYERFEPSAGGGGDGDPRPVGNEADGTVYLTTGGAGAFTADVGDILNFVCAGQVGCASLKGEHHYILFEINGNRLEATVKATAAQTFGESDDNREVIDLFALEKAGDERVDCAQFPPPGQEEIGADEGGGDEGGGDEGTDEEPLDEGGDEGEGGLDNAAEGGGDEGGGQQGGAADGRDEFGGGEGDEGGDDDGGGADQGAGNEGVDAEGGADEGGAAQGDAGQPGPDAGAEGGDDGEAAGAGQGAGDLGGSLPDHGQGEPVGPSVRATRSESGCECDQASAWSAFTGLLRR